jgi:hypothetical protein
MVETLEPVMGGGLRTVMVARPHPDDRQYVLNGNRVPYGAHPNHEIAGGCGLTHNVDKQFFDEWLHQNRESMVVKHKLIFAAEQPDRVRDQAKEMAAEKTNFEPLDPMNLSADIRVRAIGGGRGVIQKADNA